jgi:hypothetical protein
MVNCPYRDLLRSAALRGVPWAAASQYWPQSAAPHLLRVRRFMSEPASQSRAETSLVFSGAFAGF